MIRDAAALFDSRGSVTGEKKSVEESILWRCGGAIGFEHVLQEIAQLTDQLPEDSRLHALPQNLHCCGV